MILCKSLLAQSLILLLFCRDVELVELHASEDGSCDMRIADKLSEVGIFPVFLH